MANAERRRVELAFIKDKAETKKREKEEGETGEKPKFVTKAYEAQLFENKKRIDLEKVREKYDEEYSVANKEFGMMGFYSSLLTKNKLFSDNKIENKINNSSNSNKEIDSIIVSTKEDVVFKQEVKADQSLKADNKTEQDKEKSKEEVAKPDITNTLEEFNKIDKAEEYKKRYLERKRNRDSTNTETQNIN